MNLRSFFIAIVFASCSSGSGDSSAFKTDAGFAGDGGFGQCTGTAGGSGVAELCDGIDNDCNGSIDDGITCELCGNDRDNDGWNDDVEVAMETDPNQEDDHPGKLDRAVFVMPHKRAPSPMTADVKTKVALAKADIAILMDTTGSMAGTNYRIQNHLAGLVSALAGLGPDFAIGLAGYGDFPIWDNGNSQYDVPFYLVHRMMTVRTGAGVSSLQSAMQYRNIIVDGTGPWWAGMRGGDEPEQGWEALRQVATGIGIKYPDASGGPAAVPAFSPALAYPANVPSGEEVGEEGGVGFRSDAIPIIIQITDTNHHQTSTAGTMPASATKAVAFSALEKLGAKVVGLMAWKVEGHDDLLKSVQKSNTWVKPEAWGSGSERPSNCPVGRCCVAADEPEFGQVAEQPLPQNGKCWLVFRSDRYDSNLGDMMVQAIVAIANGGRFSVTSAWRQKSGVTVDVEKSFVQSVIPDNTQPSCEAAITSDEDGDGIADTFVELSAGQDACFKINTKANTDVAAEDKAQRFDATLELKAEGHGGLVSYPVSFVVPATCGPDIE